MVDVSFGLFNSCASRGPGRRRAREDPEYVAAQRQRLLQGCFADAEGEEEEEEAAGPSGPGASPSIDRT